MKRIKKEVVTSEQTEIRDKKEELIITATTLIISIGILIFVLSISIFSIAYQGNTLYQFTTIGLSGFNEADEKSPFARWGMKVVSSPTEKVYMLIQQ